MNTAEVLIAILLSIGAAQGIVFGIGLLKSKTENKVANQLLAAILFLLSYRLIVQILRFFGYGRYDNFYYVLIDLNWAIGPLLFFYIKALITPNFKMNRKHLIHFIPLVIQIGFSIFVRLQNLYWEGTRESLSWLGYWGYVVWMNNATIYFVASLLIVIYSFKAQKLLTTAPLNFKIDIDRIKWIKKIVLAFKVYFILMMIVLLVDFIVNTFFGKGTMNYFYFVRFYYYPFFIGISILTYWIGIEGYKRKDHKGLIIKEELSDEKRNQLDDIATKLSKLMSEEALYKDPDLTLNKLSKALDVKPYLLTKTLSTVLEKKFTDYINELRIEEVKRLLQDSKNQNYTLLALAHEAGFNSKASFNRAVKKITGKSPSFLKSNL
ncbi:helix-turn-helix transcriptional regulator [Spongiivirga citrea]|uniref:Helix-turn-helix domain-containing protein n=1 Tax=Spongiivirga citrea TaxID=1481457 RepID=A0A6M0CQN8_9FLAO|nr:helix-turn-helix transcriptional regulator [Spongiivirga citrea]NER18189.1 helix-turn-helix domain-containing protein [Spongiivirga citrea]